MRTCTIMLFVSLLGALRGLGADDRPAQLPDRYRDFAIYTSSAADKSDAAQIEMSVQLVNRAKRTLPIRVVLDPKPTLGFKGGGVEVDIAAGETETWRLTFNPPDGLVKGVIQGQIFFDAIKARDLFIAVRGPDSEGWQPDRKPDFDDPVETLVITDRAQVVATYAPRVRYDGWQRHPGSLISPDRRLKPFITLAEQGKTEYVIHVDLLEAGDRPEAGQGSGSNGDSRSNGGSDSFQAAVADLVRCIKIISGGAKI